MSKSTAKKQTTKGSKPKVAVVRGIAIAKVDEVALTEHLVEKAVKIPENSTLAHKVELYMDFTDALLEHRDGDYGECENCEAPCDPDDPACPVCGKKHEETGSPVEKAPAPVGKVGDLDEAVTRIKGLMGTAMRNYWQLARELSNIHDSKLYKTRVGDDKRPLYRSFGQFTEAELNISDNHARTVMAVAAEFSEQQMVELGVEKLRFIARVPEAQRSKLLERAKSVSKRELEREIKAKFGGGVRASGAGPRSHGQREALQRNTERAAERRRAAETGQAVTCTFQLGDTELPLRSLGTGKFITSEELVNNVRITYEITTSGRRHVLHIKRERMKDE